MQKQILALFGIHDLTNSTGEIGNYNRQPKQITVHKDWDHISMQYDADLALLRFKKDSITFGSFVQPLICLWNSTSEPIEKLGTVAGWDRSENKTKFYENLPRQISAPIHSLKQCLPGHPKIAQISSNRTFCAGWRNGTGVCTGDS